MPIGAHMQQPQLCHRDKMSRNETSFPAPYLMQTTMAMCPLIEF